jgi:hypothetical protein
MRHRHRRLSNNLRYGLDRNPIPATRILRKQKVQGKNGEKIPNPTPCFHAAYLYSTLFILGRRSGLGGSSLRAMAACVAATIFALARSNSSVVICPDL